MRLKSQYIFTKKHADQSAMIYSTLLRRYETHSTNTNKRKIDSLSKSPPRLPSLYQQDMHGNISQNDERTSKYAKFSHIRPESLSIESKGTQDSGTRNSDV